MAGLALTQAGCKVEAPWSPYEDPEFTPGAPEKPDAAGGDTAEITLLDVGDVEQTIWLEGRVASESKAANVKETELETDQFNRLALLTIDIAPPVPKELWLNYIVETNQRFATEPVALRAKAMRDNVELGSMSGVLGKDATKNTITMRVNAFQGLTEFPGTMLIKLDSESIILKAGTDETTVDAATVTSDRMTKAMKFNPVRINILEEQPNAVSAAPPVDAPAPAAVPEAAPAPADPGAAPEAAPAPDPNAAPAAESSAVQ
ncbi:MAG: hypothetical protein AMXMBFR84_49390 [Candidatus Hydrogenedentota bacterium]